MKKTFIIDYIAYDRDGIVLQQGKMKAKNKENKFVAQCEFEEFLKKKFKGVFKRLEIKSCQEEVANPFGNFSDIFDFGKSNPFGNFGKN